MIEDYFSRLYLIDCIQVSDFFSHIVEMFATEGRLVIAQEKVLDKAGEAQALPALLDSIDVSGGLIRDKREIATRYYGSSRKADAKKFANWIRGHW